MAANTSYVPEIVARREGKLPPSFYAYASSAFFRIRYAFRNGDYEAVSAMLTEFDVHHREDHLYWHFYGLLRDYRSIPNEASEAIAA